jgi:hypothetical protein
MVPCPVTRVAGRWGIPPIALKRSWVCTRKFADMGVVVLIKLEALDVIFIRVVDPGVSSPNAMTDLGQGCTA